MTSSTSRDMPPVHTLSDLDATWRRLVEPLGFGSRQIFAILLDRDGRVLPTIVNVTDCPAAPDQLMLTNLIDSLTAAIDEADPEGSCALLWARPSHAGTTASDMEWARAVAAAMLRTSWGRWPLHRADDSVLQIVAPDDLAA